VAQPDWIMLIGAPVSLTYIGVSRGAAREERLSMLVRPVLRRLFGRAFPMAAGVAVLACAGCVYAPPGYYGYQSYQQPAPYPQPAYAPPAAAAPSAGAPASLPANCREYQKVVMIDGQSVNAWGTACQQPDGSWQPIQSN
jgi:hypothetical protein